MTFLDQLALGGGRLSLTNIVQQSLSSLSF